MSNLEFFIKNANKLDETSKKANMKAASVIDTAVKDAIDSKTGSIGAFENVVAFTNALDRDGLKETVAVLDGFIRKAQVELWPSANDRDDKYDAKANNASNLYTSLDNQPKLDDVEPVLDTMKGSGHSLLTRHSPDYPGVPLMRVRDGVYQDMMTRKVYDFNRGFVSETGLVYPGGSTQYQTPNADQYLGFQQVFESKSLSTRPRTASLLKSAFFKYLSAAKKDEEEALQELDFAKLMDDEFLSDLYDHDDELDTGNLDLSPESDLEDEEDDEVSELIRQLHKEHKKHQRDIAKNEQQGQVEAPESGGMRAGEDPDYLGSLRSQPLSEEQMFEQADALRRAENLFKSMVNHMTSTSFIPAQTTDEVPTTPKEWLKKRIEKNMGAGYGSQAGILGAVYDYMTQVMNVDPESISRDVWKALEMLFVSPKEALDFA